MSTLNGVQLLKHTLRLPKYGSWRLEAICAEGEPLSGTVEYIVGGLTLVGKVKRSDFDVPDRPHTVAWGGLGWHNRIAKPIALQSDAGVKLSSVLKLLSAGAGEPIEQPADVTIGSHYECLASRPGEPVTFADALNDLARSGYCKPWRVDPDGVTRFGERTPVEVSSRATELAKNVGVGSKTYGIDDPAEFLPGNTIAGVPINRVEIKEERGKLTAKVFTKASAPAPRELMRQIVAAELQKVYADSVRTYVVVTCHDDGRCDLTPEADCPHYPDLQKVEQWIDGAGTFRAPAGSLATVQFRDWRRTRPIITHFQQADGAPFPDAARVGDLCQGGGKMQAINFADATGVPLVLCLPTTPPTPKPGPYLVSFGVYPSPPPPTLVSAGPLFSTITSGSKLRGVKTK